MQNVVLYALCADRAAESCKTSPTHRRFSSPVPALRQTGSSPDPCPAEPRGLPLRTFTLHSASSEPCFSGQARNCARLSPPCSTFCSFTLFPILRPLTAATDARAVVPLALIPRKRLQKAAGKVPTHTAMLLPASLAAAFDGTLAPRRHGLRNAPGTAPRLIKAAVLTVQSASGFDHGIILP